MKQLLTLLFIVNTINVMATNDDLLIRKAIEQQRLDWNKGDLEGYMQGYWNSDSLVFIGKNGPKYGWENAFQNYKKSYPDKQSMGELHFDLIKIELIDRDDAYVIGAWKLKREKDEPSGYFTLRMKKINGEWKVISDHSS